MTIPYLSAKVWQANMLIVPRWNNLFLCPCVCAGLHLIEVLFDEVSVPKSPFRVSVTEGCDPSRVRAYGPGLEEGLVNKPNRFTVETRWFYM